MTDQPTPVPPPLALNADQRKLLAEAAAYLENPSFLVKVANLVGKPAEVVIKSLPDRARVIVADGTSDALKTGLDWAVRSLPPESSDEVCEKTGVRGFLEKHRHTALTALTGAGGGMMGLPGLAVELPTTTMLMLRSIASIAAEHGADLNDPATRLECLAVFSLGSQPLEEMESAYLTTRLSLAMAVRQATHFVAQHTAREISDALAKGTAPVLMRLISAIAARSRLSSPRRSPRRRCRSSAPASGPWSTPPSPITSTAWRDITFLLLRWNAATVANWCSPPIARPVTRNRKNAASAKA